MEKPQIKTREYIDFLEVQDYIEHKYNIKLRGYTPQNGFTDEQLLKTKEEYGSHEKKPYLDFWHWICNNYEIHNGCEFVMELDWHLHQNNAKHTPEWVREILKLFQQEFGNTPFFWVSW